MVVRGAHWGGLVGWFGAGEEGGACAAAAADGGVFVPGMSFDASLSSLF